MLTIKILELANNQTKLWSAEEGRNLKDLILKNISGFPNIVLLVIDLNNIQVMDTSYAREGFIKLISEIGLNPLHPQIIFINVDEYVKQNLDLSFNHHKIFSLIKNIDNEVELIGKFSSQHLETVKALIKRKESSAKQIATDLGGIGLSTSINRLNQLYGHCVCSRIEMIQASGGKEYLFRLDT